MFDNASVFPKEIMDKAFDLSHKGLNEIAWKRDDAILAVNFLADKGYVILGGDVFKLGENDIEYPNGDSWYIGKKGSIEWKQYVNESKEKAISYINFYSKRNGDGYCYGIVYTDELHYMLLKNK